MRTTAIWLFGLVGSFLLGAAIGMRPNGSPGDSLLFGFGAALLFACIRLWLTAKR